MENATIATADLIPLLVGCALLSSLITLAVIGVLVKFWLGPRLERHIDERFEAVQGDGAWLRDRRLAVSPETEWGRALVATGFAYDVHRSEDDNLESFRNVVKSARGIRRDGSAALDLCYVAAGRVDAYWELKLHPWDVAAGYLILEEAGGRVTDFVGGPPDRSGREVASSNGALHAALLERIVRTP